MMIKTSDINATQQCVHPTGGSRRVFEQYSRLEVGSGKVASSRSAHQRVTPAVRRLIQGQWNASQSHDLIELVSGTITSSMLIYLDE